MSERGLNTCSEFRGTNIHIISIYSWICVASLVEIHLLVAGLCSPGCPRDLSPQSPMKVLRYCSQHVLRHHEAGSRPHARCSVPAVMPSPYWHSWYMYAALKIDGQEPISLHIQSNFLRGGSSHLPDPTPWTSPFPPPVPLFGLRSPMLLTHPGNRRSQHKTLA